jgi:hypothetical protein
MPEQRQHRPHQRIAELAHGGLSPNNGSTARISGSRNSLTEVCLPRAIRDHGLSPATLGLMATLNAVLVVVLQPTATYILARVPQISV